MRTCEECGTAVGDTWEYCLRCGEALPPLPEPVTTGLAGVLGRLGLRRQPPGTPRDGGDSDDRGNGGAGGDDRDDAVGAARGPQSGFGAAAARLWEATVPLWIAGAVAVVLSVALLLAVVLLPGGDDAGLDEARDAEAAALLEVDRVNGELAEAQNALASAETRADSAEADLAELNADASESQSTLAQAQEEVASLQTQLDEATGELEAQQASLDANQQHIELLQECVAGMEVVVQFARSGLLTQAAQAEEAISATCEAARTF